MRISDWSSDVCSSDLDSSKQFYNIAHNLPVHGITVENAKVDLGTFIGRKDKIVKQFTGGVAQLFKANKITSYFGKGKLLKGNQVEITGNDGSKQTIAATNVILASGSVQIGRAHV